MAAESMIVVWDFNGRVEHLEAAFWAVWDKDTKQVYFGGDLESVTPMPAAIEPSSDDCRTWAEANGGAWLLV